jgi:sulfite reductase (NADPH) hemoprotein beta-component
MENNEDIKRTAVEIIKENSNYLRGTLKESLANTESTALYPDDQVLVKFHGIYQQRNRDLELERKALNQEATHIYLVRARVPAGIITPKQWLSLDELSSLFSNDDIKLTTRQAIQFHSVLKKDLKDTVQHINKTLLDTFAASGDVNRNVMCAANPYESDIHAEVSEAAKELSAHLTPKSNAYHEIWLDKKLVTGSEEIEPLYGKHYLPRKFKIALAVPPHNDTDILSNDLGFIAIIKNNKLIGYNLTVGGGMSYTFGNTTTYPRLADVVGYFPKEQLIDIAEAVLIFQRDHGNRADRKTARLKYTIDRLGLDFFHSEIKRIKGIVLDKAKPYQFISMGDTYGWVQGTDGLLHYTVFIEGGKLEDKKGYLAKTAIREIAKIHSGKFILTPNQNLIIAQVSEEQKPKIEALLKEYQVIDGLVLSKLRQNSLACAALPFCGLAFAEAGRYLPTLIDKIEKVLEQYGLIDDEITIRMTGCPNGCARPFLAEIGLVGKKLGLYNLYLGADFAGQRLNKLYKESLNEEEIIETLSPILKDYADNRKRFEHFGDFVIRKGYVKAVSEGKYFHD